MDCIVRKKARAKVQEKEESVFLVVGGCIDDFHVIAVYKSLAAAEARAKRENEKEKALDAYAERTYRKACQTSSLIFSALLIFTLKNWRRIAEVMKRIC